MSALHGIRVLELSQGLSGDYCGRLLADFGADVIKIESPEGSAIRREGPFYRNRVDGNHSLLFWHLNAGKRGITLRRDSEAGQRIFSRLLASADVVLTSGGEDCAGMREQHPGLITVSVTPFGDDGPYAGNPGSELLCQALSGSMIATGEENREPISGAGRRGEYAAGVFAYIGTLMALFARGDTGQGQHVDVSVFESIAAMGQCFTTHYEYSGYIWSRFRHLYYPRACYPTAEGYLCFAFTPGVNWPKFLEIADHPSLADPRFATPRGRVEHREDLDKAITEWLADRTASEVEAVCQGNKLPVSRVMTAKDLLEDEHLQERGFWVHLEVDNDTQLPFTGPIFRMGRTPGGVRRRAPRLGEHNVEILGEELGLTPDELGILSAYGTM